MIQLSDLSVGQVSGIIAAAVFVGMYRLNLPAVILS